MELPTRNYIQFVFTAPVILVLAFLLLWTSIYAEESNKAEFNFVAAGDWGCDHDAIRTFSMMKSMEPELYLGLGDYSYEKSIDCWLNIVKSTGNSFKISLGNHDIEGQLLQAYMDEFGLEKQYYSFDYLNAHFIALSTELDKYDQGKQLDFARNDLLRTKSNSSIDWTIIFFHRPLYSASVSEFPSMTKTYHPIFEEFGVDLVLQGHSHNYQRSYPLLFNKAKPSEPFVSDIEQIWYHDPKGTIFIVAGTGGESVHQVNKKPFLASSYEGYGCINVEVNGQTLSVEYYSDTGDTIDRFLITKEPHDSKNTEERNKVQRIEYEGHRK